MRVVILSNDLLFGDGLRCLLGGQPWCVSVVHAESCRDLSEVQSEWSGHVVVATVDQMEIGELAQLETAKRELGLRVVAVSSTDSLSAPMDRVADRVVSRSGGFDGLKTALRELDTPAARAGSMVREPLANYGMPRRLTQREREVARLVSQGLPNRRIAKVLGIQEQSVKNLVSMVMRKLHCENRVQVALHLSAQSH